MKEYMSIAEFANRIGVSIQCLRNWDNSGVLKCHHKSEKGGYRYYTEEQAMEYLEVKKREKAVVGYITSKNPEGLKGYKEESSKEIEVKVEEEGEVKELGEIILRLVRKEIKELVIGKGVELEEETVILLKKATEGVRAKLRFM